MKRFAYLPIVLFPIAAGADVTVYFDENNVCDGLCLVKPADGQCCPSGSLVTGLRVGARADATLSEIRVGNTTLFDTTGAIKSDGITALRTAAKNGTLGTDTKITGGYECVAGASRNKNNACVSSEYEYVDDNGHIVAPDEVSFEKGGGGCMPIRDFQVRFHPVPTNNYNNCPNPPYGYFGKQWCSFQPQEITYFDPSLINGNAVGNYPFDPGSDNAMGLNNHLKCNAADGCFTLYHCGDTTKHNNTGWYTDKNCTTPASIGDKDLPNINGYTLRGYYGYTFNYMANDHSLHMITDLVTEKSTTLGAPWANRFVTTNNGDNLNLGNANLKVIKCPVQFPGNKIPEDTLDNVVIDVFGAWARDCRDNPNATCTRTIYTTQSGAYGVGDVSYTNGCATGYHLDNAGVAGYNPTCVSDSGTGGTFTFMFKNLPDTTSGCKFSNNQNYSCQSGGNETLPGANDVGCNAGYAIAGWQTPDNRVHDLGDTITCNQSVLGATGGDVNITAVICDCNEGTAAAKCVNACGTQGGVKGSQWLGVEEP